MGCDIHPAIEVLEHDEAFSWMLVAIPERDRNYELFSLLAGVRGNFEPWVEPPRSTPVQVNYLTKQVLDEDGHTASWFTLEEALKFVMPENANERTKLQWNRWIVTMKFYAELYGVGPEHVRAVFNFDN